MCTISSPNATLCRQWQCWETQELRSQRGFPSSDHAEQSEEGRHRWLRNFEWKKPHKVCHGHEVCDGHNVTSWLVISLPWAHYFSQCWKQTRQVSQWLKRNVYSRYEQGRYTQPNVSFVDLITNGRRVCRDYGSDYSVSCEQFCKCVSAHVLLWVCVVMNLWKRFQLFFWLVVERRQWQPPRRGPSCQVGGKNFCQGRRRRISNG